MPPPKPNPHEGFTIDTFTRRRLRKVLIVGGLLYPTWNFFIRAVHPDANDSLTQRLVLTAACLGLAAVPRLPLRIFTCLYFLLLALITTHIFYLFQLNQGHPIYFLHFVLGVMCTAAVFTARKWLVVYFFYCLAMSLLFLPSLTFYSVICVLITAAFVHFDNLSMFEHLRRQNEDLKSALARVQLNERSLQVAQTVCKIGHYEIHLNNDPGTWSPQAAINFGLPATTRMAEVDWHQHIHPEDRDRVLMDWANAVQNRELFDCQYRVLKPNGELGFIHGMGLPQIASSGEHTGFIGTLQDVTAKVHLEHAIKAQESQSAQLEKLTAFSEMAGGVAHEINNPLAVIRGNAERLLIGLRKDTLKNSDVELVADRVVHAVDRIVKMVGNIKSFTQVPTDDLSEESVQIIVQDALLNCEARIKTLGVEVRVDADSDNASVECHPRELMQAIVCILNNACDALRGRMNGEIRIRVKAFENLIRLSISNNGPPIPQELRSKIFQPFFTTKEPGLGKGMGLSLAQWIASNHHGALFLDLFDKETCFRLELPRRQS